MYREFHGLQERPFNLTPDTSFLYPSKAHKEVLTHLLYGINSRCGFILVTGEVGAGKTTLCRVLLNQLDESTKLAFVLNSFLTEFELLRTINQDFGLPTKGRTKMDLLDDLNTYLLQQNRLGHNVVIVVDEAQNLSFAVLEQIRMLSNLETEKEKLLQIVLVGQPELRHKLASPRLRQLSQRIMVRYHLTPLRRNDVRNYIYYRLKMAGANGGPVLTRAALDEVCYLSGGVPRLINVLCERALMISYVKGSHRITRAMIHRAGMETTAGRGPSTRIGAFFSMRFSLPRVALASLWGLPFAAIAALGVVNGAGAFGLRHEAERPQIAQGVPQAPELPTVPAPPTVPAQPRGPARPVVPDAPVEKAPESTSNIARALRDEHSGSMLGAPPNTLPPTTPLRTAYLKPDIDFTPPPANFTPATLANASFSSVAEPVVQLLLHWKVPTPTALKVRTRWAGRSDVDLAAIADECKMGAARAAMDFDTLLACNLPAVIAIKHDSAALGYITLLAIKGETATVFIKSRRTIVNLDVVRELYDGSAIFLTSDRFVNSAVLDEDSGLSINVRKLQDYLKELDYFTGNPTGWYTPDTQAAVLQFQSDHAIKPTGTANTGTKLRLYCMAAPDGTPHLKQ